MVKYINESALKTIMKAKISILGIMIFLMFSLSTVALDSYPMIGGQNSQFKTGTGFFNEQLLSVNDYTKTLTSGQFVPLVDDLDGDGANEIVVVDANVLRLFQNKELTIKAGITITPTVEPLSPPIIFDVDGDGVKEVIIAGQVTENIYVFHWNGVSLVKEFELSYSALAGHTDGEVQLRCGQTQECMMFYTDIRENTATGSPFGTRTVNAVFWNTGGFGAVSTLETTLGSSQQRVFCMPKIPEVQYADYDSDGEDEYVFSVLDYIRFASSGSTTETYYLDYVSVNRSTASLPLTSYSSIFLTSAIHNGASRLAQVNVLDGTNYKADLDVTDFQLNFSTDLGVNPIIHFYARVDDGKPIYIYRRNDTGYTQSLGNFTVSIAGFNWYNVTLNNTNSDLRDIVLHHSGLAGSDKTDFDYIFARRVFTRTTTLYNVTKERSLAYTPSDVLIPSAYSYASCNGTIRLSGTSVDVNQGASSILTSPLVADLSTNSGLETVIGYMVNGLEFKMRTYQSTGTTEGTAYLDQSPDFSDADGTLVSNPFLADVFTDNTADEYCVIGYRETFGIVDVLCNSLLTTRNGNDDIEYFYHADEYNVTRAYGKYNVIAHSTQQSTVTIEGGNPSEVLSTYGILEVTDEDCDFVGCPIFSCSTSFNQCMLNKIFDVPVDDLAMISVDAEKTGREDLLGITSTNLWYFDDGYSNSPAIISSYQINPCIDSTWKANTTVEARIVVTDVDGDSVSARAVLYDGTNYSQDSGWSSDSSSGATFVFSFTASNIVSTGLLTLYGRDTVNPSNPDSIPITFSVSTSGVEYGDCKTIVVVTQVTNVTGNLSQGQIVDLDSNVITDPLLAIKNSALGRGLSLQIIWLIVMLVLGGGIVFAMVTGMKDIIASHPNLAVGVIGLVFFILEVVLTVIGALLHILNAGVIIVLVMTEVFVVVMALRRLGTGG
jgi:hypothetical protein